MSCACGGRISQNRIQQIIKAASIFGGKWKQLPDSETMKVVSQALLLQGVNLIDCKKDGFAGAY